MSYAAKRRAGLAAALLMILGLSGCLST